MSRPFTLAVVSDLHYFSAAEQVRGSSYEVDAVSNPFTRRLLKFYRHHIWLRHPLDHNRMLDAFLNQVGPVDAAVANGDYSCDSAFVGVSDAAACQSAKECLDKLRGKFGAGFHATIGDHEFGKLSLLGARGGMRLASFHRTRGELGLETFWQFDAGRYVVMGLTSSLVGLPLFHADALPEEWAEWNRLREAHLEEVRRAFSALDPGRRVLLFCHDPGALPFLWREPLVNARLSQIEHTLIGHLHSPLFLWKTTVFAGFSLPGFLGPAFRRMGGSLREARLWKKFNVRLCPALCGIELLNDGGYFTIDLDLEAREPARFHWHPMKR